MKPATMTNCNYPNEQTSNSNLNCSSLMDLVRFSESEKEVLCCCSFLGQENHLR